MDSDQTKRHVEYLDEDRHMLSPLDRFLQRTASLPTMSASALCATQFPEPSSWYALLHPIDQIADRVSAARICVWHFHSELALRFDH